MIIPPFRRTSRAPDADLRGLVIPLDKPSPSNRFGLRRLIFLGAETIHDTTRLGAC